MKILTINNTPSFQKLPMPKLKYKPDNFDVIAPRLTIEEIVAEAERCLGCKKPPCVEACPNHNPIPFFVKSMKDGNVLQAGDILRSTQSLPGCAMVCFHFCEDACVRGKKGDPVEIHNIERYIGENTVDKPVKAPSTGQAVGIIGGGPAGITAAKELIKKGYKVHIFDSNGRLGGVLEYGIPSFRLNKDCYEKEIRYLQNNGAMIHTNTVVGIDINAQQLKDLGISAMFICSGAGKARKLDIRGEDLKGVETAHTFLKRVKLAEQKSELYDIGNKVIVVGGGNVAMDVARSAIRLGDKNVKIVYRKSFEDMPARKNEIYDAQEEGIALEFLLSPVRILSESQMKELVPNYKGGSAFDKVGGIQFERMQLSNPDANGKRSIEHTGQYVIKEANTVITALGSIPASHLQEGFEKSGIHVNADKKGSVFVDVNGQTNVQHIFAGGDVTAQSGATLTHAIAAGREAAKSIDEYLTKLRNGG